MRDIPEPDWKIFRTVREAALDCYCARVLEECARVIDQRNLSNHERYLELYRLLERRDRELAETFDAPRRSTALLQLARIHALGMVTDEELGRFSRDTRDFVVTLVKGDFGA
jgi:hypothetical protein